MRLRQRLSILLALTTLCAARMACTQLQAGITVRAESFPGTDLAEKLRSADASCAGAARPCTITVNTVGTLTAPTKLAPRHSLHINASITLAAALIPAGAQTISCGKGVALTMSNKSGTIRPAEGAADIEVAGCTATGAGQNFVELPGKNARVTVRGNVTTGFGNALLACPAVAKQGSAGWDLTWLCHDIDFVGNTVLSSTGTGVQYGGVAGGHISGNTIGHAGEGIYLNGGEADPAHALYASHSNGLSGITVTGNFVHDVGNGCLWASVSTGHLFSGNHLSHCGDVGVDFEGVSNSRSTGNVITDAGRRGGALATFFGSTNITFLNETVIVTAAGGGEAGPAIWVHNSTNDPAFTGPITFEGVDARSDLPNSTTNAIFESEHGLAILNSHFRNVQISMPFRFNGLRFDTNDFHYSVPVASGAAIAIGVSLYGGADTVANNRFYTSSPQPAGSAALSMTYSDYNNAEQFTLEGNDFSGAAAFPADIRITHRGVNPGLGSSWILRHNRTNRAPVTQSNGVGTFSLQNDGTP